MLSERYRPKSWNDFIGQTVIEEIKNACNDDWLFDGCGERWLFESDGVAGCGKTSAAYVTAQALGCCDFNIQRIDSRSCSVSDLRELSSRMYDYGFGGNGRKCYIIDEIQHLNKDCMRMLLGLLENLPNHVIVIGTTTSITWANDIDGLYSRWRRFRFDKPDALSIAVYLGKIATQQGLEIHQGFNFLGYVQQLGQNNVRDCIDQLPNALRSYKNAA